MGLGPLGSSIALRGGPNINSVVKGIVTIFDEPCSYH